MDSVSLIFIALAVVLITVAIYSVVLVLTRWYFNLSPTQIAGFSLLMFLLGILVESYLDKDNLSFFISFVMIMILSLFWLYRIVKIRNVRAQLKEVE